MIRSLTTEVRSVERLSGLERAEIGRPAGETIVHVRNGDAFIG
jgi:hypothetical protein